MHFTKVAELKLIQVELFFRFECAAANASKSFCSAHLENNERFFYVILTFHFKYQIVHMYSRSKKKKSLFISIQNIVQK